MMEESTVENQPPVDGGSGRIRPESAQLEDHALAGIHFLEGKGHLPNVEVPQQ
jgi:hypothetical protein